MRHDRASLKDNLFLRMEEGKHFMPTLSTLIIFIPYIIKTSYFLLCHSCGVFTMSLISQMFLFYCVLNQLCLVVLKLPGHVQVSLALPPFIRDLLFPSLFYLLTNPFLPVASQIIWQRYGNKLMCYDTWWLFGGGRRKEEALCLAALKSRKGVSCCPLLPPSYWPGQLLPRPNDSVPAELIPRGQPQMLPSVWSCLSALSPHVESLKLKVPQTNKSPSLDWSISSSSYSVSFLSACSKPNSWKVCPHSLLLFHVLFTS